MKQRKGLNLRVVSEDADPIPTRPVKLFKIFVHSPAGCVCVCVCVNLVSVPLYGGLDTFS